MLNYFLSLQESQGSASEEERDLLVVPSKALVYLDGTVVICRGVADSRGLNEHIGVVTKADFVNRTYKVRFEDDSLGEKTVHHDDSYILFDLDTPSGKSVKFK